MTFWNSETWTSEVEPGRTLGETVVTPYDPKRVQQGSYELALGDAYCVSLSGASRKFLSDGEQLSIPRGQFALLTTREIVTIPPDALGWISIKSKFKLLGLVNISGFHVDPGFSHRLKFSVYNAGGEDVILTYGTPLFLLWLGRLDKTTVDVYPNRKLDPQWPITDTDVMSLNQELASPAQLRKDLDKLEGKVREDPPAVLRKDLDKLEKEVSLLWRMLMFVLGLAATIFLAQMKGCGAGNTDGTPSLRHPARSTVAPAGSSEPSAAPGSGAVVPAIAPSPAPTSAGSSVPSRP